MAGLASVLELLAKNAAWHPNGLHSSASLDAVSAAAAASTAVAFLPRYPTLASWGFSSHIAHCEETVDSETWEPEWSSNVTYTGEFIAKPYTIELKPFFSAFRVKALTVSTLRALLLNFQPVLETYLQHLKPEDDDDTEEDDEPLPKPPVVSAAILKNSARTVVREVAVVTTRRVLERVAVHFASKRVAWKLLKDLPKSAGRKARRHMSRFQLFLGTAKTTFRGHALGIAASWLVQVALDIYNCIYKLCQYKKGSRTKSKHHYHDEVSGEREEFQKLGRRITGTTLKCGGSLVCASIGAGLGAVLIRPSTGQWLGCTAGEYVGAILVGMYIDSWIMFGTSTPPEAD